MSACFEYGQKEIEYLKQGAVLASKLLARAAMERGLPVKTAETIGKADITRLRSFGMTFRKAEYIQDFARKVESGSFDLSKVENMPDEQAIQALASLKGIGVWTAEMILLFCLQRPNVFSYGDLAILRGLRMVYRHRKISKDLFEKYRRRFSPCCSVTSLYLWAVAGGAMEELTDPAAKFQTKKGASRKNGARDRIV